MTDDRRLKVLERLGFDSYRVIPSEDRSGGLAIIWKSFQVSINLLEENRQFFHLQCHFPRRPSFFLTAIYAIPHSNIRSVLWANILRLANGIPAPWCVLGDFNDIRQACECIGGRTINFSRLRWFQDRINEAGLSDLGSIGSVMTWRGPRLEGGARLFERLDRALAIAQSNYLKPGLVFTISMEPNALLRHYDNS
ncbi:hypothetical protein K1719_007072 [Acacia pycnantha]|nr:hypothetical protein K1719_007072 [Acacia pycnantha]